jgi:hypothetical protein
MLADTSQDKLSNEMLSNHSPNSLNSRGFRKQSSPPESKISYHSHYVNHDGSPVSLSIMNGKGNFMISECGLGVKQPNQIKNVYSTNYLREGMHKTNEDYLDQQPTFSINSNKCNVFQQNEGPKSKSSRFQDPPNSYLRKVPHKNLKIDIGYNNTSIPECSNTHTFQKISLDHFEDRKHSTRTDGDIGKLMNNSQQCIIKFKITLYSLKSS